MLLGMLLIPILNSGPADADISLQPGGDITDNNIWLNITVNGNNARVDITNEYILIDMASLDHNYSNEIYAELATSIYGDYQEPSYGEIIVSDSFEFKFDTDGTSDNEIRVRYNMTLYFTGISGINYTRMLDSLNYYNHPESYYSSIRDFSLFIHSNAQLSVNNGTIIKSGNDIEFSYGYEDTNYNGDYVWYYPDYDYPAHEISWNGDYFIASVDEVIHSKLTPNQALDISNLVKHEEVRIEIMNLEYVDTNITLWDNYAQSYFYYEYLQPVCEYSMDAMLVLNGNVIRDHSPCILWFPNMINEANVTMSWDYTSRATGNTETRTIELDTSPISRMWGAEKGFYIDVPDFYPYDQSISDPIMDVSIEDSQFKSSATYFDIVTMPSDSESFIEFKIYDGAVAGTNYSTFQNEEVSFGDGYTLVKFSGPCLDYGWTYVEWYDLAYNTDGDIYPNYRDAFPDDPLEWRDDDHDGIGNNADTDLDNDGISNDLDSHPRDAFPDDYDEWLDTDGDGIGNNADPDDDNDGIPDEEDANPWTLDDRDGDGIGDRHDAFPDDSSEWVDTDGDGIGNNADPDDDNDGVNDENDAFPFDPLESGDFDNDGMGNNEDLDDDNDGTFDFEDAFPFDPDESQDFDGDGIGDNADLDDDNDGILDVSDAYPFDSAKSQSNTSLAITVIFVIIIFTLALIMMFRRRKHS